MPMESEVLSEKVFDPLGIRTYDSPGFYDEMFASQGQPRPGVGFLVDRLESLPIGELQRRQRAADHELLNMGITF
ncbi:MAG: hypothetical protein ACK57P_10845, partial [Planctomycetota bacterium]